MDTWEGASSSACQTSSSTGQSTQKHARPVLQEWDPGRCLRPSGPLPSKLQGKAPPRQMGLCPFPANDHNSQVSLSPCPPARRVAGYVIRGVCLTAASFHLGLGSLVGLKDIPNTRPGAPGLGQVGTTGGGWPCAQSSEGSQPAPPPSRGALQRAGGTRGGWVRLWPARDPPIVRVQTPPLLLKQQWCRQGPRLESSSRELGLGSSCLVGATSH